MAAPPTSLGYPGSVNAKLLPQWLVPVAAARFSVGGKDDWKVTVEPNLDRGIRVNAGTIIGDGIMDVFPDYDTRSLPIPSGSSQWFLVAARRSWSTPETTNLVIIPGTAEKRIPSYTSTAGSESHQQIALVRVSANSPTVQEIVDLRAWAGNGGVEAVDIMGREQLARPGAAVKIGTNIHRYEYDPSNGGALAWRVYPLVDADTGWANLAGLPQGFKPFGSPSAPASGWTGVQFRIVNGWAMINGAVTRDPVSWGDNAVVAVIPGVQGPSTQIQGTGCVVRRSASGGTWDVAIPAGTGAYSFSAMWPVG